MDASAYVVVGEIPHWDGVEPWLVAAFATRDCAEARIAGLNALLAEFIETLDLAGLDRDPAVWDTMYKVRAGDEHFHHAASYRLECIPFKSLAGAPFAAHRSPPTLQ